MNTKKYFLLVAIAFCQTAICQKNNDTAALVKEFRKVMNFAIQPYLYYTTVTMLQAEPLLQVSDTAATQGVFYKNQTNLYCQNGIDEIYLEDSLLVRVNHLRKSIWVSRVDPASKEKINSSPVSSKQFAELMQKKYTIEKTSTGKHSSLIQFETKQNAGQFSVISTIIGLEYDQKNYLPKNIQVSMSMQQPATDDMITSIKSQGVDDTKLIQLIQEKKYLVRKQTALTTFKDISNTKESVVSMPSYKQILDFNPANQTYTGKGKYSEYEVTKTY